MDSRRKKWIFDKPLYDLDITKYDAYLDIKEHLPKAGPHNLKVVHKIEVSPVDLRNAFGEGCLSYRNSNYSTREYDFTDSNLDKFLLYDYKSTQEFGGATMPDYDYEHQMHIRPMYRKRIYPTEVDFWNSEEKHMFRVNCTEYSEYRKFKEWVLKKVEESKNSETFEEKAFKKYGKLDTYDGYNKTYPQLTEFAIYKYSQKFYSGDKHVFKDYETPVEAKTQLSNEYLYKETADS